MTSQHLEPLRADVTSSTVQHALHDWAILARDAYASNTIRALRADWRVFVTYCTAHAVQSLPADPMTVRDFVLASSGAHGGKPKAVATIRRYLASIARVHEAAGLHSPVKQEPVALALRACARKLGTSQRQAGPLNWIVIQRYLRLAPKITRDHRDRALVAVAYDGMLRAEELVRIDREDVEFADDGSAVLKIERSKTDQEGKGVFLWLAPTTSDLLKGWLKLAKIESGAVFRRVVGRERIGGRLTSQSITDVFRRIGRACGLPESAVEDLSSHSARVGATQDMFVANIEMPSVMQQGRWADSRMPARYAKRVLASRGAMARLAQEQDRSLANADSLRG